MTFGVAEIGRWDPDAVRAAGVAASIRAAALLDAADALGALPVFGSWEGAAAEGCAESVGLVRSSLSALGSSAVSIADVMRAAAEQIEALRADLAGLRCDVAVRGAEILGDVVVPGWGCRDSATVIPDLQARLDALVERAVAVDTELAAALGDSPEPGGAAPSVSGPVPSDPAAFGRFWRGLSPAERDALYRADPVVGNTPGMPVGSAVEPGRDHYNRRHLVAELSRAQAAGSADLADLQALDRMLAANPGVRLMLLDTSGSRVRAAFAAGDPDTATHVSVTTPGLNTTVADRVESMAAEAIGLRQAAIRQLALTPGRRGETVAAIGWIGYQAPQIRVRDGLPGMLRGAVGVSHDDVAGGAAGDLSRFYAGIQAARPGDPAHLTAIGHSYGSLTTGLALQQGGHGVSDAVFYGSPGIKATSPADLGLAPGHVFAMAAPDDPIRFVFDAPGLARAVAPVLPGLLDDALVGLADASGAGEFGPDPAANPAFVALETDAMWGLEAAHGHSDYPRAAPGGRTTVHNLAAVVAGLGENVITR